MSKIIQDIQVNDSDGRGIGRDSIIPDFRLMDAIEFQGLVIFPLLATTESKVDYAIASDVLDSGEVIVEEATKDGTVPFLLVKNNSSRMVFFMEGEELIGGKQNRTLNTSLVVAANSSVRIPVSCVEQGRWGYRDPGAAHGAPGEAGHPYGRHGSSSNFPSSEIRKSLRESVHCSLRRKLGHSSYQGLVWDEIEREQFELGVDSNTAAMIDTYRGHSNEIEGFKKRLAYPGDALGLACLIPGRSVSFDVFDKASTCERFWGRLVSGYVLSYLKPVGPRAGVELPPVAVLCELAQGLPWELHGSVGEGVEYRASSAGGLEGFGLEVEDSLLHGSVVCGS